MIDTIDRPGRASASGFYADARTSATGLENKPMKRIPKAEVFAGAGVGHARAEWSVFEAEAKAEVSADTKVEIGLMGAEVKLLGTGLSYGRKMGISLFGNEIAFEL